MRKWALIKTLSSFSLQKSLLGNKTVLTDLFAEPRGPQKENIFLIPFTALFKALHQCFNLFSDLHLEEQINSVVWFSFTPVVYNLC